jgi:hypothetical protein
MLRFITALVIVFAATFGVANAQSDLVKRGDYLVNGILTCGNCHTPKGPTGEIMDKAFSGGLSWDEPPFKVTAPNITQDNETGIGNYTDAELKQVLRKGIKRNGVPVAMIMPSGDQARHHPRCEPRWQQAEAAHGLPLLFDRLDGRPRRHRSLSAHGTREGVTDPIKKDAVSRVLRRGSAWAAGRWARSGFVNDTAAKDAPGVAALG